VEIAFFLVTLAVAVLAGSAAASRLGVPAPLLLIALGIGASYLPGVPAVHLQPEVVLVGLLPPLLYAASLQTSLVDFYAHRRPILLLSVGLVLFTTAGVAAVVHLLLPGVTWPVSLAIGAVVAPPDAVAATAIARRIGLPRPIVTVLEGESLLNDATALVALRTALAAALGVVAFWGIGVDFVVAAGGGVLVGFLAFVVVGKLRRRVTDPVLDTAMSLVVPFAAYLAAERIHASGVVAVVVAGLLLGHRAPVLQTAPSRISERINWRTIAFVLENTVFLLIGLQARWIIADVAGSPVAPDRIALVCLATLATVIVLRILWVFATRLLLAWPRSDDRAGAVPWTWSLITGWAGMRGVVTLAAAFVIPASVEDREILLLVAFTVVAGTLFLQGSTLPWLARRLQVPAPDPAEDALARATLLQQASKAGLHTLRDLAPEDPYGVSDLIRQRVEQRNFAAWERLSTVSDQEAPSDLYTRLRTAMIAAERQRVLEIRRSGNVPAEVVSEVLAMLDVEESMLDVATQERAELRTAVAAPRRLGEQCADLEAHPVQEPPPQPACADCLAEGTVWVSLRLCLDCGRVGCCDSSPARHATRHFRETSHPVVQSAEPGEDWRWCFLHHLTA
jgi:monovalent cation/hydrogen antiporter